MKGFQETTPVCMPRSRRIGGSERDAAIEIRIQTYIAARQVDRMRHANRICRPSG